MGSMVFSQSKEHLEIKLQTIKRKGLKMEKEIFVSVEPTNIVAQFEYGDFIVEVENNKEIEEAIFWLRHRQSGIKLAIGGVDDTQFCSCDLCKEFAITLLSKHIDDAICEYLDMVCVEEDETLCEESTPHMCEDFQTNVMPTRNRYS